MGQCNSRGQSQAFTLNELADVQLGKRKEVPRGCGPAIAGTQPGSGYAWLTQRGFNFPRNGEFEYGGLGESCSMCSDVTNGYGCDNCVGAEAIAGARGTIRRVGYGAPLDQCCLNQTRFVGNQTCDPKYLGYNSDACDALMGPYCAQTNNRLTPKCLQWSRAAQSRNGISVEGFNSGNDVWGYVICILVLFLIIWFFSNYKNF